MFVLVLLLFGSACSKGTGNIAGGVVQGGTVTVKDLLDDAESSSKAPAVSQSSHGENEIDPATVKGDFDIDLTRLSSTMTYTEVYNMIRFPEEYEGKTVKMCGRLNVYEDKARNYFTCIISDATACCAQGIEFVLSDDYVYPDDYPEPGTVIVVTGTYGTYEEDGLIYCQLVDAQIYC